MGEKNYWRNFTDPGKKFIISLHYNGDESYFFVNGRQELKFKAKTDQLVKKTDQLVDHQAFAGVGPIYDMHRYLMTKHNIKP